jgi:hypothetical protein
MLDATAHLVCSAARPAQAAAFAAPWRTETAVLLARGVVADEAFDRLPVLADALEEAGCDDPLVLRHCRECRQHTAHCWVLSDVLDRPVVLEPAPMPEWRVRQEVQRVTGRPLAESRRVFRGEEGTPRDYSLAWKLVPVLVALAFGMGLIQLPSCGPTPAKPFGPPPPPTEPFPLGK